MPKAALRGSVADKKEKKSPSEVVLLFGKNMRILRKKIPFTQEKLAEEAGISVDSIKRYEKGKVPDLSLDMAIKIAKALGTSIDAMISKP